MFVYGSRGDIELEGVSTPISNGNGAAGKTCVSKRVIACLDVRTNDDGDLVVTKGDQYDVREKPVRGRPGYTHLPGQTLCF